MNRVVIKLNEHGEFDGVASDEPIEFFIYDPNCDSEPIYQYSIHEFGAHTVRAILRDHPIAYGGENILVDNKPSQAHIRIVEPPTGKTNE